MHMYMYIHTHIYTCIHKYVQVYICTHFNGVIGCCLFFIKLPENDSSKHYECISYYTMSTIHYRHCIYKYTFSCVQSIILQFVVVCVAKVVGGLVYIEREAQVWIKIGIISIDHQET